MFEITALNKGGQTEISFWSGLITERKVTILEEKTNVLPIATIAFCEALLMKKNSDLMIKATDQAGTDGWLDISRTSRHMVITFNILADGKPGVLIAYYLPVKNVTAVAYEILITSLSHILADAQEFDLSLDLS